MKKPSKKILIKYFRGQCLADEYELVELYLAIDCDHEYVEACLKEAWPIILSDAPMFTENTDLNDFKRRFYAQKSDSFIPPNADKPHQEKSWLINNKSLLIRTAAAIILVGSVILLRNYIRFPLKTEQNNAQLADIKPGEDKAFLTLANGKIIKLSDIVKGTTVALQNGVRVEKKNAGDIVYQVDGGNSSAEKAYNTVSTPNGGQYQVILPDGSKAQLNAASSLSYPVRFGEEERRVKMTGEVYFEISKILNKRSKRIPFFVVTDKQEIQVLGTKFNVNTYKDEPYSNTTLVEGSVRVTSSISGKSVMLKPGQQASLSDDLKVNIADMEQQLAWKNGDFIFNQEQLSALLRKVSRWYNVEVVCPEELGKIRLTGMISRNQPLPAVVQSISSIGGAKITLKERRIIVEQ